EGVREARNDGSTYIWSIEDLLRLLKEFSESGKKDFIEWFNEIKDQLSEDAAGNLMLLYQSLRSDLKKTVENVNQDLETTKDELYDLVGQSRRKKDLSRKPISEQPYWSDLPTKSYHSLTDNKNDIDLIKNYVDGITIVLRIYIDDKELKFVEDFDILKKSIDYAIDNNLDFSMLKVHCTETNEAIDAFIDSEGNNFWDKYVIKVKDAAEKLIDNKEKTRLCIFNEMKTFYLEEKYEALMS